MMSGEEEPKEEVPQQDVAAALAEAGTGDNEEIPQSFPQKLMQVLADPDNADVISWLPHGKGFIIYKKKKFASDVLPKAFKQSKYTSFTRKLNRWGFTRVTRGPETGAYYHKYFQRGDTRLCMQMSCQSSSKNPHAITGSKADLQNQQIIRQQLQQLQMHQFHLQQMQMQQMQAAELFRQQQAQQQGKTEGDDKTDGDKPATVAAMPVMAADNPYLQSLQQQAAGGATMGFLPVLQPGTVFPGGMVMPQMAGVPQVAAPVIADGNDSGVKPEGTDEVVTQQTEV